MTLRDKIRETLFEQLAEEAADVWPDQLVVERATEAVVETVATWLECDDVRPTYYDGMSSVGPTTKNIGIAIATRARRRESESTTD